MSENIEVSPKADTTSKSKTAPEANGQPGEGKQLTEKQLLLIGETWAIVSKDLEKAGLIMFMKLFEIAPELIKLFPFKDQQLTDENELLKKHAMQVMESINDALGMIDRLEEMQESLIGLGIVHNMSNVKVESFAPVGTALIFALERACGEKFTPEVQEAWVTLYSIVQHFMTLGMNEGLEA